MSAEPSTLVAANGRPPRGPGRRRPAHFTDGVHHPFDLVTWSAGPRASPAATAPWCSSRPTSRFRSFWSQSATNIVAQKYFHGRLGTAEREDSVRTLIGRVVRSVVLWGQEGRYLRDAESAHAFADD